MYVKQISEVKSLLDQLRSKELIDQWELPYENLLTRLTAAIFFITPREGYKDDPSEIWHELGQYENFSVRPNYEKKLSTLSFRITFSQEEKEKNSKITEQAVEQPM